MNQAGAALILTAAAAERVLSLALQKALQPILRVYITGGGCSGFQYGFKLETALSEDDLLFQQEHEGKTFSIAVDPMSYLYLEGSSIDFIQSLQGSKFQVSNPKADTTCSCGSSFSIKDDAP